MSDLTMTDSERLQVALIRAFNSGDPDDRRSPDGALLQFYGPEIAPLADAIREIIAAEVARQVAAHDDRAT